MYHFYRFLQKRSISNIHLIIDNARSATVCGLRMCSVIHCNIHVHRKTVYSYWRCLKCLCLDFRVFFRSFGIPCQCGGCHITFVQNAFLQFFVYQCIMFGCMKYLNAVKHGLFYRGCLTTSKTIEIGRWKENNAYLWIYISFKWC